MIHQGLKWILLLNKLSSVHPLVPVWYSRSGFAEMLKLVYDESVGMLKDFIDIIDQTGQISNDWLELLFIALPMNNSCKCYEFCLLSLMSHALKSLQKVIQNCIFYQCDWRVG